MGRMAERNGLARQVVFWGLCVLVVFLPLPLGSVLEWAVFAFEAAVAALFLAYLWGGYAERRARRRLLPRTLDLDPLDASETAPAAPSARVSRRPASEVPRAFKALIWVFLGFSALQLVPLPPALVALLSPRAAALYAGLVRDRVPGWTEGAWQTLSLSPSASLGKLVLMLAVGVFGFLVLRCVRSRREVETFVLVLIACGLFQAFYGMAETFSGHEMIFGVKKRYVGSVSGTFYNRNHLAGFLEMAFPLSLGYLLVKARYFMMEKGMSLRRRILWFSQERLQLTILFGMASVFIALGLVFSRSRSGVTIFAATLLLAAFATSRWRDISAEEAAGVEGYGAGGPASGRRAPKRSRAGRTVRVVAAAVIVAAVWIGLGPVIERFSELDISREWRRVYYRNSLELVRDFPFAGTGKGTFLHAYNMYEKVDDHVRISFAHNDYLEFLAENGVVAGGCLVALGVGFAVLIAVRWSRRRNNFSKGVGLGALLGVTAILAHGFTDFNLQIPANAACFAALVALGLNTVRERSRNRSAAWYDWEAGNGEVANEAAGNGDAAAGAAANGEASPERGPGSLLKAILATAISLLLLAPAAGDFIGHSCLARYRETRRSVRSVQSGFPKLEPLLRRAVGWSKRAEFRVELARLYYEMARVENDDGREEERDRYCDLAIAAYEDAIRRNPADAFTHYETGLAYLFLNYPVMPYVEKAKVYFRRALELKPADESLNLNVVFLHMTWWSELEQEEKEYAAGLYRRMMGNNPAFGGQVKALWRQSFGSLDERYRGIIEFFNGGQAPKGTDTL
jgi:O-antigen ligase